LTMRGPQQGTRCVLSLKQVVALGPGLPEQAINAMSCIPAHAVIPRDTGGPVREKALQTPHGRLESIPKGIAKYTLRWIAHGCEPEDD